MFTFVPLPTIAFNAELRPFDGEIVSLEETIFVAFPDDQESDWAGSTKRKKPAKS